MKIYETLTIKNRKKTRKVKKKPVVNETDDHDSKIRKIINNFPKNYHLKLNNIKSMAPSKRNVFFIKNGMDKLAKNKTPSSQLIRELKEKVGDLEVKKEELKSKHNKIESLCNFYKLKLKKERLKEKDKKIEKSNRKIKEKSEGFPEVVNFMQSIENSSKKFKKSLKEKTVFSSFNPKSNKSRKAEPRSSSSFKRYLNNRFTAVMKESRQRRFNLSTKTSSKNKEKELGIKNYRGNKEKIRNRVSLVNKYINKVNTERP